MAEVKTIKIDVDTKQAVDAMENLSKATNDVNKSFEEVYGDLQPLTTRMGEAEDRLYELANAGKSTTQEYKDLLKTVGDYRKVQIQTDMAVDAAAGTMSTKLGGALGGATAGFQLVQGAMGAFGSESAKVEEALLKVQSAMAIADGVRGFREAIPSIKSFGVALKSAIGASGIGLLVIALGTLAAYWDDIKSAVGGVSDEQSKLNAKTDANVLAQQKKYDTISGQDNILKLQGKSEQDILKIKAQQIDAVIKATEAQLVQQESTKKAQVMAARRNREILTGILTFLTAPLQLLLGTVDLVGKALGKDFNLREGLNKSVASLVFDPEETADEADKVIEETKTKLAQLKNEAAGFKVALVEMNKPGKEVAQKVKDDVETYFIDPYVQAFDEAVLEQDFVDEEFYNKSRERATEEIAAIEADNQLKIDANLDLQQALTDASLERIRIEEEAEAEKQRKFKENLRTSVELSIKGLALIASIAEMNAGEDKKRQRTAFNIRKAANIASATMDGYNAVLSTFAETKGGIVLKSIAATIAGGFAALQIAGIAKTQFDGGGGVNGNLDVSTPSGGAAITPSFNVVGNSGMNQLAQIQQQPIQAYVVSGEVTSAQALDRNRIKNATL
jgi:hypothetical protein